MKTANKAVGRMAEGARCLQCRGSWPAFTSDLFRSKKIISRTDIAGGRVGFSLIELLVAGCIIAMLVALLLPAVIRSCEKSRKAGCQEVLRRVYLLTRMYADEHDGEMPLRSALFANGKFPDCPSRS